MIILKTVICILLREKDEKSAHKAAVEVVDKKIGNLFCGGPFEYFRNFEPNPAKFTDPIAEEAIAAELNKNICSVLCEDHNGHIPSALQVRNARHRIEDTRGLEIVNFAMESNRGTFESSLAQMKWLLENYTEDQLFDDDVSEIGEKLPSVLGPPAFRFLCEEACGSLASPGAFLYDWRGRTISRPWHLERILEDSDFKPWYRDLDFCEGDNESWGRRTLPLWVVPFDAVYCDELEYLWTYGADGKVRPNHYQFL